jgi:hypothetical protein
MSDIEFLTPAYVIKQVKNKWQLCAVKGKTIGTYETEALAKAKLKELELKRRRELIKKRQNIDTTSD